MCAILGYALFGLDSIASQMTNPFGDDPNDLVLLIDYSISIVQSVNSTVY